MPTVQRRDDGQPIRDAMKAAGMSGPTLAAATRRIDPLGRGISRAIVGRLTGTGITARGACRLRTAQLIAGALDQPVERLFFTSVSTSTVERSSLMATKTLADRAAILPPGVSPLLNQQQLAARYGVSDTLVRQWIRSGCPTKPTPNSTLIRFDLTEVEAWIQDVNERAA